MINWLQSLSLIFKHLTIVLVRKFVEKILTKTIFFGFYETNLWYIPCYTPLSSAKFLALVILTKSCYFNLRSLFSSTKRKHFSNYQSAYDVLRLCGKLLKNSAKNFWWYPPLHEAIFFENANAKNIHDPPLILEGSQIPNERVSSILIIPEFDISICRKNFAQKFASIFLFKIIVFQELREPKSFDTAFSNNPPKLLWCFCHKIQYMWSTAKLENSNLPNKYWL